MDTQNSRKMRDGLLPVAANSAADARPSAESLSAEPPTTDQRLTEKDIVGLKYFDQLLPLFQRLHHDGCQRDKAGNRELHFDQTSRAGSTGHCPALGRPVEPALHGCFRISRPRRCSVTVAPNTPDAQTRSPGRSVKLVYP